MATKIIMKDGTVHESKNTSWNYDRKTGGYKVNPPSNTNKAIQVIKKIFK